MIGLQKVCNVPKNHRQRTGDSGSPCFTPLRHPIGPASPLGSLNVVLLSAYKSTTILMNHSSTPCHSNAITRCKWLTVSNAFAKSRVDCVLASPA